MTLLSLSRRFRHKLKLFLESWTRQPVKDPLAPQVRAVAKLRRQHKPSAAALRALREARHERMRRVYG